MFGCLGVRLDGNQRKSAETILAKGHCISKTTPTLVWYVVIIRIVISLSIGGLYACLKIGETNTQLKFNYRDNDDELVHFGVTYFLFGPRISVLTFPSVIFAIIIAEQIPNFCCSDSPSLLI